jgi:hypothetical protein
MTQMGPASIESSWMKSYNSENMRTHKEQQASWKSNCNEDIKLGVKLNILKKEVINHTGTDKTAPRPICLNMIGNNYTIIFNAPICLVKT